VFLVRLPYRHAANLFWTARRRSWSSCITGCFATLSSSYVSQPLKLVRDSNFGPWPFTAGEKNEYWELLWREAVLRAYLSRKWRAVRIMFLDEFSEATHTHTHTRTHTRVHALTHTHTHAQCWLPTRCSDGTFCIELPLSHQHHRASIQPSQ